MLIGGVDQHRYDLSSMIMLKDNHIWSKGSITKAVEAARSVGGFAVKIEVEVQSEKDANEAITAGADIVMLDNFSGEGLKIAAGNIKGKWAGEAKHVLLECSGGLTEENVAQYCCNGECASAGWWGVITDDGCCRYRHYVYEFYSPGMNTFSSCQH